VTGDNLPQQRLGPLGVDGEVVIDEKDPDFPLSAFLERLQEQQLVDDALIGAKTNRVAKKTGHRAELATVRTTTTGFNRNHIQALPRHAQSPQNAARQTWH